MGTLAGKGVMADKHKGGKLAIKIDEPSYIMGIVSITPRICYSQGNEWDVDLDTMDDFHKPALDGIGFQDLITERMAWWDTINGVKKSAGKQTAWLHYQTNFDKAFGDFANPTGSMFMTLNRRYERGGDGHIKDLTSYIDPSKYNYLFGVSSLDSQNFQVQIGVDIFARRVMSASQIPNL